MARCAEARLRKRNCRRLPVAKALWSAHRVGPKSYIRSLFAMPLHFVIKILKPILCSHGHSSDREPETPTVPKERRDPLKLARYCQSLLDSGRFENHCCSRPLPRRQPGQGDASAKADQLTCTNSAGDRTPLACPPCYRSGVGSGMGRQFPRVPAVSVVGRGYLRPPSAPAV